MIRPRSGVAGVAAVGVTTTEGREKTRWCEITEECPVLLPINDKCFIVCAINDEPLLRKDGSDCQRLEPEGRGCNQTRRSCLSKQAPPVPHWQLKIK